MKKLFLFMCAITLTVVLNAQEQVGLKPYKAYCEIVGTGNITGTKVKIEVDFGQQKAFWTQSSDSYLVDDI